MSLGGDVELTFDRDIMVVEAGPDWIQELLGIARAWTAWNPASMVDATGLYQNSSRNNTLLKVTAEVDPRFGPIEVQLTDSVGQCVLAYRNLNRFLPATRAAGFQILRYEAGQHFREHIDNAAEDPVRGLRQLSVVIYLNDDYEGGELVFPRQQIKLKPKAGSIVLFPSHFTHSHASLDVQSGVKFSCVTWLLSGG